MLRVASLLTLALIVAPAVRAQQTSYWEIVDPSELAPSLFPPGRVDGYKAIHAVTLKSGNLLIWDFGESPNGESSFAPDAFVLQDPTSSNRSIRSVPFAQDTTTSENHRNPFCAGHQVMDDSDGTVFAAGGHFGMNLGTPLMAFFKENTSEGWIQPKNDQGPILLNRSRWYPTVVPFYPGRFLVIGGSTKNNAEEYEDSNEVVTFDENQTPMASLMPWPSGFASNQLNAQCKPVYIYYAWHFPFPQPERANQLFHAGPFPKSRIYDLSEQTWSKNLVPNRGSWADWGFRFGYSYPSAAFIDGKVFVCGGGAPPDAQVSRRWSLIDLNQENLQWQPTSNTFLMNVERKHHVCIVMPTGKVFISRGANSGDVVFAPGEPERMPEIFDPEKVGTNENPFTLLDDPAEMGHISRGYHSTALLMPDGSIYSGGGNNKLNGYNRLPDDVGTSLDTDRIEFYKPAYMRDTANRPILGITEDQDTFAFGDTIPTEVQISPDATLKHYSLISLGSTTHAYNMGQRYYKLELDANNHPIIPNKPWYLYSGWYMLFAVDTQERVSVSKIIRVTDPFSRTFPSHYRSLAGNKVVEDTTKLESVSKLRVSDGIPRDFEVAGPQWPACSYTADVPDSSRKPNYRDGGRVVLAGRGSSQPTTLAVEFDTPLPGPLPAAPGSEVKLRMRIDASFVENRSVTPEISLYNFKAEEWVPMEVGGLSWPSSAVVTGTKDNTFELELLAPSGAVNSWSHFQDANNQMRARVEWPGITGTYRLLVDELMLRARI